MTTTAAGKKTRRRRAVFSRQDRATLFGFVGIPTFLHVALVWIPAIMTIMLSFTYWNGIALSNIRWAGLANYNTIFTKTPIFYQALWHNVIWLLFFTLIFIGHIQNLNLPKQIHLY